MGMSLINFQKNMNIELFKIFRKYLKNRNAILWFLNRNEKITKPQTACEIPSDCSQWP